MSFSEDSCPEDVTETEKSKVGKNKIRVKKTVGAATDSPTNLLRFFSYHFIFFSLFI